ncbi:MAG TPA: type II secretion system protein GspE, partial [Polyangia bacterium]|nr:type II secretion system protein GspE [Polyangia bacterium]
MASKRIGELLLELKRGSDASFTPAVIEQALVTQQAEGGRLGEILVKARAVTEEEVLQALGKQLGIAYSAELKVDAIDTDLATGIPIGFAKQHRLLA